MNRTVRMLGCVLALCAWCMQGGAAVLPEGFVEEVIATGLDPTAMALAPDGRIFIAEKNGRVRIVRDGALLPQPVLTLPVDNYNERGLSGIAADPDFVQNHYLYLFYTVPGANHNRVSRFTLNGDFAVPGSETILLDMEPLSGTIHNGGAMHFGPDGKLYIATGDGSNAANSQDLGNLLGKILRINADGSIPADNPYYAQTTGARRAIYALGLRNPFSTAIEPGTGRIFANDVGGGLWEEVNAIEAGDNLGWPLIEGPRTNENPPPGYADALYAYDHDIGCSVIGAAFYTPEIQQFPSKYAGMYLFGDYCNGTFKVLNPATGQLIETFAEQVDRPLQLLVTPDGDLYYLSRGGLGGGSELDNTSTDEGTLWRVRYAGVGAPVIGRQPQSVLIPAGETARFFLSSAGTPPLSYQWQRDGADLPGAASPELLLPNAALSDSGALFRCIVSNAFGRDTSSSALLRVTRNRRPLPVILTPAEGTRYRAGDTLRFSGAADDPEEGPLDADALTWRMLLYHDAHTHPALAPVSGIAEGSYIAPTFGETDDNVWYRLYLTARDGQGLTQTVTRDIYPEKVSVSLRSEPAGITFLVDAEPQTAPATFQSVRGIRRTVEAPQAQVIQGVLYVFSRWDDGSTDRSRAFFTPASPLEFKAVYDRVKPGQGSGLSGAYRNSPALSFEGSPVLTRTDATVDFDWALGSPAAAVNADYFTVRWEGEVQPYFSELISFHVLSDDGVRLWVNGTQVIGQWQPQGVTETTGSIALTGGFRYPVRLEYFEQGGEAVCRLLWSSARTPRQVIPSTQLYPADAGLPPVQLEVFPSPVSGSALSIRLTAAQTAPAELRVYTIQGQLLHSERTVLREAETVIPLDLSGMGPGLYLVEMRSGELRLQAKVVRL
ncbi:MAG: PQQ-dependent sugar dehydrogenase [Bacteroidia bacterium]|nr:PQQ-dependent sugar dehydrogenase [Bacteroidia bacterium]